MNKIKQFYELFKYGQQVSNPEFWKKGQAFVQPIVATLILLLVAILKGFGYDLPVSDQMATTIAGALFFIINGVLTVITTTKLGVKPSLPTAPVREAQPSVPSDAEAARAAADAQVANEQDVPSDSQARVEQSSIDDDVRKRAEEWVRQHSVTVNSVAVNRPDACNGLQSDA